MVAGNLFHPDATSDLAKFVDATFSALPTVREEIRAFCASEQHRLVVLPGRDDHDLRHHVRAQLLVEDLGATIATDLVLQVATASGVRDVAVAAGTYDLDLTPVDPKDRRDAAELDDPQAMERFVASRVLYRRLAAWVWLPLLAIAFFDLWSAGIALVGHFTHHDYSMRVCTRTTSGSISSSISSSWPSPKPSWPLWPVWWYGADSIATLASHE